MAVQRGEKLPLELSLMCGNRYAKRGTCGHHPIGIEETSYPGWLGLPSNGHAIQGQITGVLQRLAIERGMRNS